MSNEFGVPQVLENWLAADRGEPILQTIEVPLYTDAWITGAAENLHPYEIINLVPVYAPLEAPTLALRIELHIDTDPTPVHDSGPIGGAGGNRFTGARSLGDELAALLSLAMGARIAAGGATRYFEPLGDPRGRPTNDHSPRLPPHNRVVPRFPGGSVVNRRLIPSTLGPLGIEPDMLELLHRTPPSDMTVLLRAARAYRDGLWIAEDEPALAWVLFVSAVEVAAVHHRDSGSQDPADVLRNSAPRKFIEALEQIAPTAVAHLAPHVVSFFGSASRFKAFIKAFFPPEPAQRSQPPFTSTCSNTSHVTRCWRGGGPSRRSNLRRRPIETLAKRDVTAATNPPRSQPPLCAVLFA